MVEVLSGPERRRRRTPQEKNSHYSADNGTRYDRVSRRPPARYHANQIFKWRRQYENGSLTAVASGEEGGLAALDAFAQSWDARYPQISKSWRANQVNLSTLFAYPEDIRRAI